MMLPPLSEHPLFVEPRRLNIPLKRWECCECNKRHSSEYAAEECCRPEIYQVWGCPVCGEFFDTKAEACECCPVSDPAAHGLPSRAELESAGQLPMFEGRGA